MKLHQLAIVTILTISSSISIAPSYDILKYFNILSAARAQQSISENNPRLQEAYRVFESLQYEGGDGETPKPEELKFLLEERKKALSVFREFGKLKEQKLILEALCSVSSDLGIQASKTEYCRQYVEFVSTNLPSVEEFKIISNEETRWEVLANYNGRCERASEVYTKEKAIEYCKHSLNFFTILIHAKEADIANTPENVMSMNSSLLGDHQKICLKLANLYEQSGNYNEAILYLKQGLELISRFSADHYIKSNFLEQLVQHGGNNVPIICETGVNTEKL